MIKDNNKEYPEFCPVTGNRFFMCIEHPKLGHVPTYGGPSKSYTIPQIDDEGKEFHYYCFHIQEVEWSKNVLTITVNQHTAQLLKLSLNFIPEYGSSNQLRELLTHMISILDKHQ